MSCGNLYKGITRLKQPSFWGPLDLNIVQMNLYKRVTCLKQPISVISPGDLFRQIRLYLFREIYLAGIATSFIYVFSYLFSLM